MTTHLTTPTGTTLLTAAQQAGLTPTLTEAGTDFHGKPTARVSFTGTGISANTGAGTSLPAPLQIELSEGFNPSTSELQTGLTQYLRDLAARLRNPQPDLYVTAGGLPLRFTGFTWPFHASTSGADTSIVHGVVQLADGTGSPLHAKISASMTVTFAEIVAAPEQPYAEDFIYNAIRKTFDYGQLELLKSGNRQPVPVTTRYYSRWGKKFQFTDTTDATRAEFLALKAFWLSGVHGTANGGGNAPVWLADPRDAQYLNTTPEQLVQDAQMVAQAGFITVSGDGGYGAATPALLAREPEFREQLAAALNSIKPAFNEAMRGGLTNM